MKVFVSAVTRSTLTGAIGSDDGKLRLHVCKPKTTFPSVCSPKFQGSCAIQTGSASFDGIADELFGVIRSCAAASLTFSSSWPRSPYVLGCHGSILLLLGPPSTDRGTPDLRRKRGRVNTDRSGRCAGISALLASLIPARRAPSVNPVEALNVE
jgi:hypothetical protein